MTPPSAPRTCNGRCSIVIPCKILLIIVGCIALRANFISTTKTAKRQLDAHASIVSKDKEPFLLANNDKTSWYTNNEAAKALQEEFARVLSPEELRHWHETPVFHPYPSKIPCPRPEKFEPLPFQVKLLDDLTSQEKNQLRQQLENGSSTTIRNAFMPWIDVGFHPDLILHGGKQAGLTIGIFNGTLHFSGKNHKAQKVRLLAEHLEPVLHEFHERGTEIPDVIFPYTVRSVPFDISTKQCAHLSVPPHLQDRYNATPVAGIAMDPTIHTGVALMPNMYFGNLRVWDRYTKQLLDGGKADTAWNKRHQQVFWRGQIKQRLDANAPRLEALQAAARDKEAGNGHLDIALTHGCHYLHRHAKKLTQSSSHSPKWTSRDYFLNVTKCSRRQQTPHAKYTSYWALLNLPGSTLGSYSKNLQNLWPTGAAAVVWNQSAVEFYYDSLQTGITHVWVNETTFLPTTELLLQNEGKLARLLGTVGREWFQQHLTSKAILDYYYQWFQTWAALQRFKPSPRMLKDPCTCAGWIDGDKEKHGGIKRCKYCPSYPHQIEKGCLKMMGKRSSSLCRE